MIRKLIIGLYVIALIFTRFWNVENTARFTRDESYDIVKLHQYWKEKRITLVGAIDYTGTLVYSSLTYYTMMPFAVLGNFEPASPVYAFSVMGVVTVVFIYLITREINDTDSIASATSFAYRSLQNDTGLLSGSRRKKILKQVAIKSMDCWNDRNGRTKLWLVMILALVWFPLLQASRWSWNPYFLPFSTAIALYLFLSGIRDSSPKLRMTVKNKMFLFLSGVFFGFAFHYHYISIVANGSFLLLFGIWDFVKNKKLRVVWILAGFILMILPYFVFDLRHPPGLFFTKYLHSNLASQGVGKGIDVLVSAIPGIIYKMGIFLSGNWVFSLFIVFLSLIIGILDIRNKKYFYFIFILPVIFQTLVITFLPTSATRYFLPALIFFLIWLIQERKAVENKLTETAIILLILGNLSVLPKVLLTNSTPSPKTVGEISNYITKRINEDGLKNVNVCVLQSPDPDPLGAVYRDVLLSKEIRLMPTSEFHLTDNLFVISTSDIGKVKDDPANVINDFRQGVVRTTYKFPDSEWVVYLLNRY